MQLSNSERINKKVHTYSLCGLHVTSELDLPELPQLSIHDAIHPSHQVHIQLEYVPEELANAKQQNGYQVKHKEILLDIPDIARYLIKNGNEILVNPMQNADNSEVRLFLLGSAFGALLHQRGILPMHASAIEVDHRCILFVGDSGSGKSTIAAFLHNKGYRVLTDDVCAITFDNNNQPIAWPGLPRVKLWSDTLVALETTTENLVPDGTREDKYHIPLNDSFSYRPLPITQIYALKEHDNPVSKIKALSAKDAVTSIIKNIYRDGVLNNRQHKLKTFKQCMSLVKNVNVYQLSRIKDFRCMDEVLHNLDKNLFKNQSEDKIVYN